MKRIPKKSLKTGDKVLFRGTIYAAVECDGDGCCANCDLYDAAKERCPGLCYRYLDERPVVFRYVKDQKDTTYSERIAVSTTDFTAESVYEPKLPWN